MWAFLSLFSEEFRHDELEKDAGTWVIVDFNFDGPWNGSRCRGDAEGFGWFEAAGAGAGEFKSKFGAEDAVVGVPGGSGRDCCHSCGSVLRIVGAEHGAKCLAVVFPGAHFQCDSAHGAVVQECVWAAGWAHIRGAYGREVESYVRHPAGFLLVRGGELICLRR